jgi:hypothetical protein
MGKIEPYLTNKKSNPCGLSWPNFLALPLPATCTAESFFRSDITSRLDGPTNHTGSNISAARYNNDGKRTRRA